MKKINYKLFERLEEYDALISAEFMRHGYHKHSGISYDEIHLMDRIKKSREYHYSDTDTLNRIERWFNEMNQYPIKIN
jgi:hypothetical protein